MREFFVWTQAFLWPSLFLCMLIIGLVAIGLNDYFLFASLLVIFALNSYVFSIPAWRALIIKYSGKV